MRNLSESRRFWLFRGAALAGSLLISALAGRQFLKYRRARPPSPRETSAAFQHAFERLSPECRRALERAGYGPAERLVLPANFDGHLVFSSRVMQTHVHRGYAFRPAQQNLWMFPPGMPNQMLAPDTDELREAAKAANISITAHERINSLGCRGPESRPLDDYRFRVLVLGDSFTQGILVDESQIFCTQLATMLESATGHETLVINSGVIGYSTEQQYHTMVELSPRVRPHVIVLCFYVNDVHRDHTAVLRGNHRGDWTAAREWLERIVSYCRVQRVQFLLAAIPDRTQMIDRLSRRHYQHPLEQIAAELAINLLDPDERFLSRRETPLWLEGDAHLAPLGHALFADALADHVKRWAPAS